MKKLEQALGMAEKWFLRLKWFLAEQITESRARAARAARRTLAVTDPGIDGILVTVGLCIIALLLCVVMKDSLAKFIETIVASMTSKATGILGGTTATPA